METPEHDHMPTKLIVDVHELIEFLCIQKESGDPDFNAIARHLMMSGVADAFEDDPALQGEYWDYFRQRQKEFNQYILEIIPHSWRQPLHEEFLRDSRRRPGNGRKICGYPAFARWMAKWVAPKEMEAEHV